MKKKKTQMGFVLHRADESLCNFFKKSVWLVIEVRHF